MTQDEIIKMVIQAEILAKGEEWVFDMSNAFELTANQKQLEAFAKLVAEHEREACAKTVETIKAYRELEKVCFKFAAKTIRARGQA